MADKKIDPKAMQFIDESASSDDMHPEANQYIDQDQAAALVKHLNQPHMSQLESAWAGLAAAPTEGLGTRLGALTGVGLEKGAQALGMGPQGANEAAGQPTQSVAQLYNEYLAANQKRAKQASADNPWSYGGAEFAGGMALPWSKLAKAGKLAKGASMTEKLVEGGKLGAKMGAITGAANSPDYTDIPKTLKSTAIGTAVGAPLGMGGTALTELLAGGASAAGAGARSMMGPVGTRFEQGQQAFKEGIPSLATQEGLEQAKATASKPVKTLLNDLQDTLQAGIKGKAKGVEEAGEKFGPLPTEKVDEFYSNAIDKIQGALEKTKDKTAAEELMDLMDKFTTAKEGKAIQQTQRIYAPGKAPPLISAEPQARAPEVMPMDAPPQQPNPDMPPEVGQQPPPPMPQLGPGQPSGQVPATRAGVPAISPEAMQGNAEQMGGPAAPSPEGFGGYKKVMATTIDKNDKEALKAFHQKVMEKQAEEQALPGAVDQEPIEVVPQAIEGYPDKVRLVARRKVIDETDQFADQAASLSKNQKEAQRLQDMLAKSNQEGQDAHLKQLAQDAQKPDFEDVQVQGRAGGQDIYDPSNMAALQQDLQDVSPKFNSGYTKTPSGNLATQFSTQARNMVADHSPDIQSANTKINATKNIFESLGLDADKLIQGGGTGQKEFVKDLNGLYDLFKPETNTPQSLVDSIITPEKMDYIQEQLTRIDPEMAQRFAQTADKQKAMLDLIRDFQKPWAGWSLHSVMNAARSFGGRTAYQAGYALEREKSAVTKMAKPLTDIGQKIWPAFTSDSLKNAADKAAADSNPDAQKFSRVLSKLSQADDRTKNSMLFILQQNVGYRQMMDKYMPQEEEKTPQAKDKNLEKFK